MSTLTYRHRRGSVAAIRCRRQTTSPVPSPAPASGTVSSSSRAATWAAPSVSGGCYGTSATTIEPAELLLRDRHDDTIEADELAQRRDELVVVDARLPERWRGEPNPIDKKPGRIPGALNAPWNEPMPELPDGELVAYCGSGVTASVVLHRLHLAGRDGRLYPGSWSEWEQLDLPVEGS